jgi:hypothetical protein
VCADIITWFEDDGDGITGCDGGEGDDVTTHVPHLQLTFLDAVKMLKSCHFQRATDFT